GSGSPATGHWAPPMRPPPARSPAPDDHTSSATDRSRWAAALAGRHIRPARDSAAGHAPSIAALRLQRWGTGWAPARPARGPFPPIRGAARAGISRPGAPGLPVRNPALLLRTGD